MPKIKTREVSTDPKIGVTRPRATKVGTPGIRSTSTGGSPRTRGTGIAASPRANAPGVGVKGYSKASPERIVGGGEEIMAQVLGEVAGALIQRHEQLRKGNSDNLAMTIEERFLDRKERYKKLNPSEALKLLEPEGLISGTLEDLKKISIPEDLDKRTKNELNLKFRNEVNKEKREVLDFIASQATEVDKVARSRRMSLDYSEISKLAPNINSLTKSTILANTAAEMEINRKGNEISDVERNNIRAFYKEQYVSQAFTKWFIENPVMATKLWHTGIQNETLQKMLPTKFNALTKQYHTALKDATTDVAIHTAINRSTHPETKVVDYHRAAQWMLNEDFVNKNMNGDFSSALTQSKNLEAIESERSRRVEKARRKQEQDTISSVREMFTDKDTGDFIGTKAAAKLRVLARGENPPISPIVAESVGRSWQAEHRALQADPGRFNKTRLLIGEADGDVSDAELYNLHPGQDIATLIAYRDKVANKWKEDHGQINQIKRVSRAYDELADDSEFNRGTFGIKDVNKEDFLGDLLSAIKEEGYDIYDTQIYTKLFKDMIQPSVRQSSGGITKTTRPTTFSGPGAITQMMGRISGTKYGLQWQLDDEAGSVTVEPEIDTGGNLPPDPVKAMETLQKSPHWGEAVKYAKSQGWDTNNPTLMLQVLQREEDRDEANK